MKVTLYIAGRPVDLDDQSLILFNYTYEDLTNPTVVKNSYSKKVTLQGTPNNNAIFGDVWRLDRSTVFGTSYVGPEYDPTRRTEFRIMDESGAILESGYVKLESIKRAYSGITYEVNLFGGLGSFFYGLTYKENGDKVTLADLTWSAGVLDGRINKATVADAWQNRTKAQWQCINFAPCYNGTPSDFDANKVLVSAGRLQNVPTSVTSEGKAYTIKSGASTVLVTMANKHTEWEMKDLRAYLQRPVFSVAKFLDAICDKTNNGGYDVTIAPQIQSNTGVTSGWITLALCPTEYRNSVNAIKGVLATSATPCDYLVGLAKMFGWCFLYDSAAKSVTITTRNAFYGAYSDILDLTPRIDNTDGLTISPLLMDTKIYQLGGNAKGEWAEAYKAKWGRAYGVQRINTGYEFNSDAKELTKDIAFTEAAEVQEASRMLSWVYGVTGSGYAEMLAPAPFEECKEELYNGNDSKSIELPARTAFLFGLNDTFADYLPKVQLHESDNKADEGANVLLVYDGMKATPSASGVSSLAYYLTDDHADIARLNGGTPCWCITNNQTRLTSLPSYRRSLPEGDFSCEWGIPSERAADDIVTDDYSLYEDFWRAYLVDRYDVDTKVLKCKVNLRGLNVGQDLLRRFWWFEGALWVLNKISNHSITTDDLTECEFIKVKNKANYINGQRL